MPKKRGKGFVIMPRTTFGLLRAIEKGRLRRYARK